MSVSRTALVGALALSTAFAFLVASDARAGEPEVDPGSDAPASDGETASPGLDRDRVEAACARLVELLEADGVTGVTSEGCIAAAAGELAGCIDADRALACATEAADLAAVDVCFEVYCPDETPRPKPKPREPAIESEYPGAVKACEQIVGHMKNELGDDFDPARHTTGACLNELDVMMLACAHPPEAIACIKDAADSEAVAECFDHCEVDLEIPADADPAVAEACVHVVQVIAGESGQRLAVSDCVDGLADDVAACEEPAKLLECLAAATDIDGLAACESACTSTP